MSNVADWNIRETHPELADQIVEALRQVLDPEMGISVIKMGLIRDISIDEDENEAHIVMILTNPFCPFASKIMENVRSKVADELDMTVTIEKGEERWDPTFMENDSDANWEHF
jgi:serine O-acetyltransferase